MKKLLLNIFPVIILSLFHITGRSQGCSYEVTVVPTHVKCNGLSTGSAVAIPAPAGTYKYLWSTGSTASSISNLKAGTYFVKVSDPTGCEVVNFITIEEPPLLKVEATLEHPVCFNENSGSISLKVTGGVQPYTYTWSNNVETPGNPKLFSGTYESTVTDANYCENANTYTLVQPDKIATISEIQDVTGYGLSDGSVNISVKGGVHPYLYSWTGPEGYTASTEDIYNIPSAEYDLNITDSKNCPYDTSVFVPQPDSLALTAKITDVFCNAFSDGAIDITVTGGVPPYRYSWANEEKILTEETPAISGLPMGNYYLIVTDNNDITLVDSFYVGEPQTIVANIVTENAFCYDSLNGNAFLTVSGGKKPFSFLWSNGASTQDIEDVHAGEYEVEIVDANGCFLRVGAYIGQPDSIRINTTVTNVSCKDHYNGKVFTDVEGGIPPYEYSWSNSETGTFIEGLTVGTYTVTVTDSHECPMTTSEEVTKPMTGCIEIPNAFTPNGDDINDTWVIKNSYLYPDIQVLVLNNEGYLIFEDVGYDENWDGTFNGNDVSSGTYYYLVDLHNGDPVYKGLITIIR